MMEMPVSILAQSAPVSQMDTLTSVLCDLVATKQGPRMLLRRLIQGRKHDVQAAPRVSQLRFPKIEAKHQSSASLEPSIPSSVMLESWRQGQHCAKHHVISCHALGIIPAAHVVQIVGQHLRRPRTSSPTTLKSKVDRCIACSYHFAHNFLSIVASPAAASPANSTCNDASFQHSRLPQGTVPDNVIG